jgi:hypothetical protein
MVIALCIVLSKELSQAGKRNLYQPIFRASFLHTHAQPTLVVIPTACRQRCTRFSSNVDTPTERGNQSLFYSTSCSKGDTPQ